MLHPQDAVDFIENCRATKGHIFFLRGGRREDQEKWADLIQEIEASRERGFTIWYHPSPIRGRTSPRPYGGICGILQTFDNPADTPDVIILCGPHLTRQDEMAARGLATMLEYRLTIVDHFLTPEERETHHLPEIVPVPPWEQPFPDAIIVDLDGTLADSSHRSPFGASFEEIQEDTVIPHVSQVVRLFANEYGHHLLFVTGRGYQLLELNATSRWLVDTIGYDETDRLFGRQPGDTRPDHVVKLEIFNREIRGKYNVKLVLDDRPSVIRMWTALGLPVLANKAYVRGEF